MRHPIYLEIRETFPYDRLESCRNNWIKKKPLALSLYQSLITDEIWSESRMSLGYKDITKMPLLYSFLGTPYIDLRTDINSYISV